MCVTIPLGSRQNSFSADTSFFLSFFFSQMFGFPKRILTRLYRKKFNLMEIQIFATLKERKKE